MTVEQERRLASKALVPLAWDTDHFGFSVARMHVRGSDLGAARRQLELARETNINLVYWQTETGEPAPSALLVEFGGKCVAKRVLFQADLSAAEIAEAPEAEGKLLLREYPRSSASSALRSLALAAGEFSRFRLDSNIPKEKFDSLYTIWIERSTRRELADKVLIAEDASDGRLLGMITIAAQDKTANIGLISVDARERGRGVARLLMHGAHRWMISKGCRHARVVTQLANIPASRLYESCGYRLVQVHDWYHFWPLGPIQSAEPKACSQMQH
jgi:dTDP-4-amino-4,6-dideoxy-D-galactose acyltransferase